jgi:hypothetical protein
MQDLIRSWGGYPGPCMLNGQWAVAPWHCSTLLATVEWPVYSDWDREEGTDDAVLIGSPKDPLQRPLSNHGVSATADAELLQSAPAQEVDSARVDSMPCAQLAAVYPSTSWDPCHANAELLQSAPAQEVE